MSKDDEERKEWLMYIQSSLQNYEARINNVDMNLIGIVSIMAVISSWIIGYYFGGGEFFIADPLIFPLILLLPLLILIHSYVKVRSLVKEDKNLKRRIDIHKTLLKEAIRHKLSPEEIDNIIEIFETGEPYNDRFEYYLDKFPEGGEKHLKKVEEILKKALPDHDIPLVKKDDR